MYLGPILINLRYTYLGSESNMFNSGNLYQRGYIIARPPHEPPAILSWTPRLSDHPLDPTQLWHGWLRQINVILANIGRKTPFDFKYVLLLQ